ncbi:MAG: hypothetical protein HYV07_06365 [Deltaproteobacteria bacterium]|nr:hypothetical protein [Deltaproteobacteria bacterium]
MSSTWLVRALLLAPLGCPASPDDPCAAIAEISSQLFVPEDLPQPTSCPSPATPRDLSGHEKLAVAVFHFNLQYVAGGVRGFPDGVVNEVFDLDEAETEDAIIRVSFEPLLDALLTHPTFAVDIELQGYMIEILARRHTDVLDKLRELAARGQVDVDSFHYSDQLYVAYPRLDLERSLELTKRVFDRTCIRRGQAVFTQEGQFARGQLPVASGAGFTASILPKNLYSYQLGQLAPGESTLFEDPRAPGHTVILGGLGFARTSSGGPSATLEWTFMDDGEIAFAKNRLNPYFGRDFIHDPAKLSEYLDRLADLERRGYVLATVHEAVTALRARGVEPKPLPKVLDGTWQPDDTNNVFRWMGGSGLFRSSERDSDVLAATYRARTSVERAERFTAESKDPRVRRGIDAAWREALLAQVSDSTGWNPFKNEIAYSLGHANSAEDLAARSLACAGVSPPAQDAPACVPSSTTLEDLGIELVIPNRTPELEVESCPTLPGRAHRITLTIEPVASSEAFVDPTETEKRQREVELRAKTSTSTFLLVGALTDHVEEISLDEYEFDDIGLPLADGLIGLGQERWLIQDLSTGRVAAILSRTGELRDHVRFFDMTVSRLERSVRSVYLVEDLDPDSAHGLARRVNRP